MPKLKPNPTEEANRVARAAISSNMELYGISEDLLAKKLDMTKRSVQNRRDRPETCTLQDLRIMASVLKWTPLQAASIVLGRPLTSGEVREFILM